MRKALLWFRNDLRLSDHPALLEAVDWSNQLLCVYVLEEESAWARGAASRVWLWHSLRALDMALKARGNQLHIVIGDAQALIPGLCESHGLSDVLWSRRYRPDQIEIDKALMSRLKNDDVQVHSLAGEMLHQPWSLKTGAGGPYKVFTPFWKQLRQRLPPPPQDALPERLPPSPDKVQSLSPGDAEVADKLLPALPWGEAMIRHWQPGEAGARRRFEHFLKSGLSGYDEMRDRPDRDGTSQMSAALHFGEVAPARLAADTLAAMQEKPSWEEDGESFLSELGWREFSRHLLYHFPTLPDQALNSRFRDFPWADDDQQHLRAWQRGETGVPIVDAGMRQLYASGWMHNRVRMIVGSFLCKNLLLPWQLGEAWFWDTLVDADLANNAQGWQWIGGCGADAAPYFRVFNPVRQAERFDPKGDYIARWVPELHNLPAAGRHAPWEMKDRELAACGFKLGRDYPQPLVDLKTSRKRALSAWETVRS
jgi:deoxyribodipyrimidine photo-lyase